MVKRIFLSIILAIFGMELFVLTACEEVGLIQYKIICTENWGYTIQNAEGNSGFETIVQSMDEWEKIDPAISAYLTEKNKTVYDKKYFETKVLLIFNYVQPSSGGQVENIKVKRIEGKITVDIQYRQGFLDAISSEIIVLEVDKSNIQGTEGVSFQFEYIR